MIDYDPHDWRSHLLDIKGSMVREIIGRVLTCVAWSAVVGRLPQVRRPGGHPVDGPQPGRRRAGPAAGLPHERVVRPLLGGPQALGRHRQRVAQPGAGRRACTCRTTPSCSATVIRWTVGVRRTRRCTASAASAGLGPVGEPRCRPTRSGPSWRPQHVPLAVAAADQRARWPRPATEGLISDYRPWHLDHNVQLLIDYLGGCERIHKTPAALRLRGPPAAGPDPLLLHAAVRPGRDFGWGTVLDTLLVAYVFFGIEEIGVEIEDPFGHDDNDLPLERICATIEDDLLAVLNRRSPPPVSEHRPSLRSAGVVSSTWPRSLACAGRLRWSDPVSYFPARTRFRVDIRGVPGCHSGGAVEHR